MAMITRKRTNKDVDALIDEVLAENNEGNEVESGTMTALDRYIVETSDEIYQDYLNGKNYVSLEEAIAEMERETGKRYHVKI